MKNTILKLPILLVLFFASSCSKDELYIDIAEINNFSENSDTTKLDSISNVSTNYSIIKDTHPLIYKQSMLNHERNKSWYSNHKTTIKTNTYVAFTYADINHDGLIDQILVDNHWDTNTSTIRFFENIYGDYREIKEFAFNLNYIGIRKLIVSDINNDGFHDFVFGLASDCNPQTDSECYKGRGLYILKGSSEGYKELITVSNGINDWTHSVTTGDVNNDGFVDIYAGGRDFIYIGNGDFTFKQEEIAKCNSCYYSGRGVTHELIDINNDGFDDMLVGYHNNTDDHQGTTYSNSAVIYYGTGTYPYFGNEYQLQSIDVNTGLTLDFATYDFDGDGDLDLFVNSSYMYNDKYVIQYYENNGFKNFVNKTTNVFESDSFNNYPYYIIDWIKVVDHNNNGKLDLLIEGQNWERGVSGNWISPSFTYFELNSKGKFQKIIE
jgi:hypothetical protein